MMPCLQSTIIIVYMDVDSELIYSAIKMVKLFFEQKCLNFYPNDLELLMSSKKMRANVWYLFV